MNDGYNGNPNLKKPGVQIEWTPERLAEIAKCAKDPIYFAEQYIKIVTTDHGLVPIKLYDYQKDIANSITTGRTVVAVTSRQAGKCIHRDTKIKLRNKRTGEINEISIGSFYENLK